ncbi:MAG: TetR/AcrR family transcriptional regulator [Rhizobiaceae bacterium]|nr:TetR/AcrR family transcriptional regulator [Rhizobiaceae bacterium]MCV0405331.1 TetR/AcrR family transcriptional regulator [Rhizobiaceae bacterium]
MEESTVSLIDVSGDMTDAPMTRAERRDHQLARILDAAKICFVRSGFQGASMQQICAECGMSPGALYRYFPSKEAIIEAITEADRKNDAAIFAEMMGNPDPVDGVVQAAMAHIRHIHEAGKAPLFTEIRAESMRNDAVDFACKDIMGEVQQGFHAYLQAAVDRGEIDPVVPLDQLMPILVAIGEGMAINDLPANGVGLDNIETVLRAMIVSSLRPTGRSGTQD